MCRLSFCSLEGIKTGSLDDYLQNFLNRHKGRLNALCGQIFLRAIATLGTSCALAGGAEGGEAAGICGLRGE